MESKKVSFIAKVVSVKIVPKYVAYAEEIFNVLYLYYTKGNEPILESISFDEQYSAQVDSFLTCLALQRGDEVRIEGTKDDGILEDVTITITVLNM